MHPSSILNRQQQRQQTKVETYLEKDRKCCETNQSTKNDSLSSIEWTKPPDKSSLKKNRIWIKTLIKQINACGQADGS